MSVYLFWIIIFLQEQYLNYSRLIYSEGNQNKIYDQMLLLESKFFIMFEYLLIINITTLDFLLLFKDKKVFD